jgi:hypothetical protein
MLASALDLVWKLDASLPREVRSMSLRALGLRLGEIIEIAGRNGRVFHCEIYA